MSEAIVSVGFRDDLALAQQLLPTGFLPSAIKTPGQALAIMLTGRELGIPAMQSLRMISIIQGKPTISPELMLALAYQRIPEFSHKVKETTPEKCTIEFKRKGSEPYVHSFTAEDAKKMALWGKDNWVKQPATMLRWRCVSAGLRIFAPDLTIGVYVEGEIEPKHEETPVEEIKQIASEEIKPKRATPAFSSEEPGETKTAFNELADAFLRHKAAGDLSISDEAWWKSITHFEKNGKVYESTSLADAQAFYENTYKKYGKAPQVFVWRKKAEDLYPHLFGETLESIPDDKIPF